MEPYAWAAYVAQRDAAYWAGVSAITATIGLLITVALNVGGLFFLWRQLKANEQAVKDAAAAAAAAQSSAQTAMLTARPWLELEVTASKITRHETHQAVWMEFVIRNIGATPATRVWFNADIARVRDKRDLLAEVMSHHRHWRDAGTVLFPKGTIRHTSTPVIPMSEPGDPEIWRVSAVVFYFIQGEAEPRYTSRTVTVSRLHAEDPAGRLYPDLAMSWAVQLHDGALDKDMAT